MPPVRTRYSAAQIVLHWIIAVLIVAGALYHHFVLKTDVMRRILRQEMSGV